MFLGESAVKHSGIVPAHEKIIVNTAKLHDCIIMVRPVNRLSTTLIEEGYATKDLHVKGKSSDWGPQAGFICCDQYYSKLVHKGWREIEKFNHKATESIRNGSAKAVPLLISEERLQYLLKQKMLHGVSKKEGTFQVTCHGKPHQDFILYPNGRIPFSEHSHFHRQYRKDLHPMFEILPHLRNGYWVMTKKGNSVEPIMALAETSNSVPLTADYDLFCVAPHLSQFDSDKPTRLKFVVKIVQGALAQKDRRIVDADLGKISQLTQKVKQKINQDIGVNSVIHHGCEVDNPVTELDYPITAFTPWKQVVGATNQQELQTLAKDILRIGYIFYPNRLWSQTDAINSNCSQSPLKNYQWNTNIQESELSKPEVLSPPNDYTHPQKAPHKEGQ
ncbi:CyaA/EF/ExoY family adenylyl cyclase toxin [Vibrio hepatarius]|uniref:CyaA/EF/ExoY family adenylyl cyclase toxin n=1 Tax=Vibrio hepatarius TaxID=171383 RepID=UPI001C09A070|nr:CyaA/EF/ExoY family adenylyl cyclase toxin [Vibrio hepatarius]MBU2896702.1 CyaA/EF/ExoY family adenylyl cyclase toxin [Vibrio hepatarius]